MGESAGRTLKVRIGFMRIFPVGGLPLGQAAHHYTRNIGRYRLHNFVFCNNLHIRRDMPGSESVRAFLDG